MEQLDSGKLSFVLNGKKLRGEYTLVKLANRDKQWLLIKKNDSDSQEGWKLETVLDENSSKPQTAPVKKPRGKHKAEESESAIAKTEAGEDDYRDMRGQDTLTFS